MKQLDIPLPERWNCAMARKPRLEYAGAIYHVMSRGNHSEGVFRSDVDCE